MDRTELHLEIRNALELCDELGRYEHALGDHALAARLSALRSGLDELERVIGRAHDGHDVPLPTTVDAVVTATAALTRSKRDAPPRLRRRFAQLTAAGDRVVFALLYPDARLPAKPLAGALPLARVVPQSAHAALDGVAALACLASIRFAQTPAAQGVGALLGATRAGIALTTDSPMSPVKLVSIEVHEGLDHAWGLAAIAAPFVLGYARRDPIAAAVHVASGVATILVSLFTDYRADKGVTWPVRSRGGPEARHHHHHPHDHHRPAPTHHRLDRL